MNPDASHAKRTPALPFLRGRGWRLLSSLSLTAMLAALVLCHEPPGYALFLFSAAILHECGHLTALLLMGEPLPFFRARQFGFLMTPQSDLLSYRREVILCMLGPLFNLLAALALVPVLQKGGGEPAFCFFAINILTAFFNLLPITGFDGGRCLAALSAMLLSPRAAHTLCSLVSLAFSLIFYFFSLFLFFSGDGNAYPLLLGFFLLGSELRRHGEIFFEFGRKREKMKDIVK